MATANGSHGVSKYDYAVKYNTEKTNINIALTSSVDFDTIDTTPLKGRTFALNIGQTLSKGKTILQIGWKKDLASDVNSSSGFSNLRGSMPKLIRFALCIRAKLFANLARTPRNLGAIAACSLDDPCP